MVWNNRMSSVRQQNFLLRKEKILAMAETLLLDNNQDITLSELAAELDIAKGTIYKHFKSKNGNYGWHFKWNFNKK